MYEKTDDLKRIYRYGLTVSENVQDLNCHLKSEVSTLGCAPAQTGNPPFEIYFHSYCCS